MKGTQARSHSREVRGRARGAPARPRLRDERGQVLVLAALMLTVLLGFLGLVVDAGLLYAERRQAQNAADEATLAAVYELSYGGSAAVATAAALENAAANGYNNDGVGNTVTVNIPPISGEHIGDPDYVEVVVSDSPQTFFIHVVMESDGVSGRGVAGFIVGSGGPYALFANEDQCGAPDPLTVSGSYTVVNGAVHSNADINVNGSNNSFNGPVTYSCNLDVGGQNNTFNPAPASAPNRPLPVSYTYGDFPCTMTFTQPTDLNSVPAAWVGGDKDSGQLIPGVYCSTKKLSLSGSDVSGNVTLVSLDEVNISGSNFNLTPYWNNVLAFGQGSFPKGIDMSGSGGDWLGMMLAPNGLVKVAGSSNLSYSGAIIADRIRMSGSNLSITAVDYGFGGPPSIALVE